MSSKPFHFSYPSMGTTWEITIWDTLSQKQQDTLRTTILEKSHTFDRQYSRFNHSSIVSSLSKVTGVIEVPHDLIAMLQIYRELYKRTEGKCTPLVGYTLSDMGYDEQYSLMPKKHIREVPDFLKEVHILDDTHIELSSPVLLDLGAVGKGYFVDSLTIFLQQREMKRFLVNGSGDIFYQGNGQHINLGLEDPQDPTKVIGMLQIEHGAMCASANNRRKWANYSHTIDPHTRTSVQNIIATWVMTEKAALADGLATCLFLVDPTHCTQGLQCEYCILNREYKVRRSKGFHAELFK